MNAAKWGSTLVWLDLCGLVLGTLCVWPGVAWRLEEGGARDNAHIIGMLGLYPPADRCLMPPELTTRYAVKNLFPHHHSVQWYNGTYMSSKHNKHQQNENGQARDIIELWCWQRPACIMSGWPGWESAVGGQ